MKNINKGTNRVTLIIQRVFISLLSIVILAMSLYIYHINEKNTNSELFIYNEFLTDVILINNYLTHIHLPDADEYSKDDYDALLNDNRIILNTLSYDASVFLLYKDYIEINEPNYYYYLERYFAALRDTLTDWSDSSYRLPSQENIDLFNSDINQIMIIMEELVSDLATNKGHFDSFKSSRVEEAIKYAILNFHLEENRKNFTKYIDELK